jgi:hypothetical protein
MVRKARGEQRHLPNPSPAEIRRRAEVIRSGWSEHEFTRRSTAKPISWLPPILPATEFPELTSDLDAGALG